MSELAASQEKMLENLAVRIDSLIDETLDEYPIEGAVRDGLRHDIGLLAQSILAMSRAYIASHDTFPSQIALANGRVVSLSVSGEWLTVS